MIQIMLNQEDNDYLSDQSEAEEGIQQNSENEMNHDVDDNTHQQPL